MTILQALRRALMRNRESSPSAQLAAEILLSFVLNRPIEYLWSHSEHILAPRLAQKFNKLLARHLKGRPIAYLIGRRDFYKRSFVVSPAVLIPRSESERLIDLVRPSPVARQPGVLIADIGTGSGNLVVTLAGLLPHAKFIATDISSAALRIAALNTRRNKLARRIRFYRGSLLAPIRQRQISILIANLPYLTKYQITHSPTPEIMSEPIRALAGGRRGFEIIHRLLQQIADYKMSPALIVLEIDPAQKELLTAAVHKLLPSYAVTIQPDYCGLNRFGVITKRRRQALAR